MIRPADEKSRRGGERKTERAGNWVGDEWKQQVGNVEPVAVAIARSLSLQGRERPLRNRGFDR